MWLCGLMHALRCAELAMVHISVFDEDVLTEDDFIGQVTVPFASIQPGLLRS